jgi:aminoglycoside phosphotransferase (APT) family kinase protein
MRAMGERSDDEVVLQGGVANAGAVVRVGDHVLRPSNPHTPVVHRFLRQLRAAGFTGASSPIGVDHDGRERLGFVEGQVAVPPFPAWVQTDEAVVSITELLAAFHRATASVGVRPGDGPWSDEMADPLGGPIVCHNDVCLENVVFRDGRAVALLDFDFCAPGRPVYDLAQFARMCVPVDDDVNTERLGWHSPDRPSRLRLVADTYGLDPQGRDELLAVLDDTMERAGEFVRRRVERVDPGFVAMWKQMGGQERFDRRRRWWLDQRPAFARALDAEP